MGLKKAGHTLANPREEKSQGNEIADDPGNDEQESGDGPEQAFGGSARNGFPVAGGRTQHGEYVGAAPADKRAACKDPQNEDYFGA